MNIFQILGGLLLLSGITAYLLRRYSDEKTKKLHSHIIIPIILISVFVAPMIVPPIMLVYIMVTYKKWYYSEPSRLRNITSPADLRTLPNVVPLKNFLVFSLLIICFGWDSVVNSNLSIDFLCISFSSTHAYCSDYLHYF